MVATETRWWEGLLLLLLVIPTKYFPINKRPKLYLFVKSWQKTLLLCRSLKWASLRRWSLLQWGHQPCIYCVLCDIREGLTCTTVWLLQTLFTDKMIAAAVYPHCGSHIKNCGAVNAGTVSSRRSTVQAKSKIHRLAFLRTRRWVVDLFGRKQKPPFVFVQGSNFFQQIIPHTISLVICVINDSHCDLK